MHYAVPVALMSPGWAGLSQTHTGFHEGHAFSAGLLPVSLRQVLGLSAGKKTRVGPAVMAHGQRAMAQVDDLHSVRMTAPWLHSMVMVTHMSRSGCARRHLAPLSSSG